MALLKAKKHVLCEKPATSNTRELEELLAFAKQNGLVFLEAMRPMFSPGFAWIKENLHKIGKIHQATLKFCKYSSRYDNFKNGII
jgi:predicted dehydrogenase